MIDKMKSSKRAMRQTKYLIWSGRVRKILTKYWREVRDSLKQKDEKIYEMKLILLLERFVQ